MLLSKASIYLVSKHRRYHDDSFIFKFPNLVDMLFLWEKSRYIKRIDKKKFNW